MAEFFGFDEAIASTPETQAMEAAVRGLWKEIVGSVEDVLRTHVALDFVEFHKKTDPTIEEMELSLTAIHAALRALMDSPHLTYEASQHLDNSTLCTHLMLRLFIAIRKKNRQEYDVCIEQLARQKKY